MTQAMLRARDSPPNAILVRSRDLLEHSTDAFVQVDENPPLYDWMSRKCEQFT